MNVSDWAHFFFIFSRLRVVYDKGHSSDVDASTNGLGAQKYLNLSVS